MSEEEVPWPDAPEGEEEQDGPEYDRWRGTISDWKPPGPKGGPARFKIGNTPVQVWPKEFQSEDDNPVFLDAKQLAFDGAFVEAYGEEKEGKPFYSERAKRNITPTNRTVYGIEKAERQEGEDDPQPVGPAAKKAAAKAKPKGDGQGKYKGLTPEEWDAKEARKNQHIDAWAALKIVVPILYNRAIAAVASGSPIAEFKKAAPSPAEVEAAASALIGVARKLAPDSLSSTSGSAKEPPSTTSEPAPPSAPAPKEKARSKESAKPSAD